MEIVIDKEYQRIIDKLVEAKRTKNTSYIDEAIYILSHLGNRPKLSDNVEQFIDITNNMVKTYAAKNHDYGNSFDQSLYKFGLIASIVRMNDKMNRLETLASKKAEVKDESVEDTLLDLANYAIMTVMWLRNSRCIDGKPQNL